jgi:hypothetical protein
MHEALLDAGACGAPPLFVWAACPPPTPEGRLTLTQKTTTAATTAHPDETRGLSKKGGRLEHLTQRSAARA